MKDSEHEIKSILYSNSKVSATECEAITRELIKLISERDKEWYKNLELATTAVSEDGKVRFVRIDEPDFTSRLQIMIK